MWILVTIDKYLFSDKKIISKMILLLGAIAGKLQQQK